MTREDYQLLDWLDAGTDFGQIVQILARPVPAGTFTEIGNPTSADAGEITPAMLEKEGELRASLDRLCARGKPSAILARLKHPQTTINTKELKPC